MSAFLESAKNLVRAGLGLLYPEVCQLCGVNKASCAEGLVCGACRSTIRKVEPPFCHRCGLPVQGAITAAFECTNCKDATLAFSTARSAVVAKDNMLEIIHRYKYKRALWFEPLLGTLLAEAAAPNLHRGNWDWIVPVPLHPVKQREREFNQAERLAAYLSRATGIRVGKGFLRRTRQTRTQTLLSRAERRENVRHAFALRGSPPVKGARIVLLDDVFTTGATTGACAAVLRGAGGAEEVCVWTVARGI